MHHVDPIPGGYRRDSKGRLVPERLVKPQELLEDQTVAKILGYADDLEAQISRFRAHTFEDVGAFLDLLGERYGAKRGGAKGNITLRSYDGTVKVQIAVADSMVFGPELQVAKELIDDCIEAWSEGARDEIKTLVQHAFKTDKEGEVSREAVFALRRVKIDDERWQRAMEAITDSIRIVGSKTYVRFYRRSSPEDRWRPVSIDIASARDLVPPAESGP